MAERAKLDLPPQVREARRRVVDKLYSVCTAGDRVEVSDLDDLNQAWVDYDETVRNASG